jgi:hypothetical protein
MIPTSSRGEFTAGLAMWSACRPHARLMQRALWFTGLVLTPRLLPFGKAEWEPPMSEGAWNSHRNAWRGWFGRFDHWAAYHPSQPERQGFALLLFLDQEPVGFVKSRPEWDFAAEFRAQASVQDAETFQVPTPAGVFNEGGWSSLGMTPLPPKIHKPGVVADPERLTEEISELLEVGQTLPEGWSPAHGDLGPWNLRRVGQSRPFLFDWEHAAPMPSGSDLVFYVTAARAMGINVTNRTPLHEYREAIKYWSREIPDRFGASARDSALAGTMLQALTEEARETGLGES